MTSDARHTIVAVSSPPGRSVRGLIRLSGSSTFAVLNSLLNNPIDRSPRLLKSARLALGNRQLPILLTCFEAPKSFTGEDMAELQLPGSAALLDRVLHLLIDAGASLAEPGEFTFRAYTNGKLDLTQAEGVAAAIGAVNDAQLQAAHLLLDGQLGSFSRSLTDDLAASLALVEAGIDFTDQEDVVPITPKDLDDRLADLLARISKLKEQSRSWGELQALPQVVLVGLPSSGKSTLFNALLGRPRAVAHAAPGTTRDVLSEPLTLQNRIGQPVQVMLVDIAGLDAAEHLLDKQAQAAAHRAIERADLLLSLSDSPEHFVQVQTSAPILRIASKADVAQQHTEADLAISAQTGEGLDALRQHITQAVASRGVSLAGDMLALQPRHESAINAAIDQLKQSRELLATQLESHELLHMELVAGHLRDALDAFASLGGEMTPDDVIGKVFATFCVGK